MASAIFVCLRALRTQGFTAGFEHSGRRRCTHVLLTTRPQGKGERHGVNQGHITLAFHEPKPMFVDRFVAPSFYVVVLGNTRF